jgi:hypothetical protein
MGNVVSEVKTPPAHQFEQLAPFRIVMVAPHKLQIDLTAAIINCNTLWKVMQLLKEVLPEHSSTQALIDSDGMSIEVALPTENFRFTSQQIKQLFDMVGPKFYGSATSHIKRIGSGSVAQVELHVSTPYEGNWLERLRHTAHVSMAALTKSNDPHEFVLAFMLSGINPDDPVESLTPVADALNLELSAGEDLRS